MQRSKRNRHDKQDMQQDSNVVKPEKELEISDNELGSKTKRINRLSVQCIPVFNKRDGIVYFDVHIEPKFFEKTFCNKRSMMTLQQINQIGLKPKDIAEKLAKEYMDIIEKYINKMSRKVKQDKEKAAENIKKYLINRNIGRSE